jgi:hypothetical protein
VPSWGLRQSITLDPLLYGLIRNAIIFSD